MTRFEIMQEIENLEGIMNRAGVADANLAELRRDDLLEVYQNMRDDQLIFVEL